MRLILLLLLLAAPLCAEAESNFGRVTLANSDAIVLAVASAKRTKVGGAIRVELTVSETLYGDKVASGVSMFFSNPDSLLKDEAMRALFALKKLSDGGYKLVGKPMLTPESGTESAEKIRVVKAFVALEAEEAGKDRTKAFWKLLQAHIKAGGFSAEDAAIELIFVARDRSDTVTLERFESVVEAEETAKGNLTKQAKADLHLARKGMVETRIKGLRFRGIRRGEKKTDKRAAAGHLLDLIKDYPKAFSKADLDLINAMAGDTEDSVLEAKLEKCSEELALDLATRK